MLVSILHRISGAALSVAGLALLTWWLMAIADGPEAYAAFTAFLNYRAVGVPIVLVLLVGLTWAFFQHMLSGIRHLVMDSGGAFELDINKRFAILTIVGSLLLTAAVWANFLGVLA